MEAPEHKYEAEADADADGTLTIFHVFATDIFSWSCTAEPSLWDSLFSMRGLMSWMCSAS